MAFNPEVPRAAVAIGEVGISLRSIPETVEGPAAKVADYTIHIYYDDGTSGIRSGNLIPHLTTAERDWLLSFMEDLTDRANAVIPTL